MQISKSFLVFCATLFCAGSQLLYAADTDAQIKAREALRKKMDELQPGSTVTTAPAPVVTPQEKPAPVKPSKAVAKPAPVPPPSVAPPPATPEVVVTPPADSEAVARAREALRKKMDELQAQQPPEIHPTTAVEPRATRPAPVTPATAVAPPPAVTTAPPPVAPAPAVVPQPVVPAPAPAPTQQPDVAAPAPSSNERQQAEQAAQNQAKTKPSQAAKPQKSRGVPPVPAFRPIEGPALNISAEKQQKLAELLRRYQADEVTPAQYHEERAKILSQP